MKMTPSLDAHAWYKVFVLYVWIDQYTVGRTMGSVVWKFWIVYCKYDDKYDESKQVPSNDG